MKDRRVVKNAHEDAVIQQFVEWLNKKNKTNYKVIEKPDPPDAVFSDGQKISWVEHSDLYRNGDEAKVELTALTIDTNHIPLSAERPIVEPDKKIAYMLIERMRDKLNKDSYKPCRKKYGKGYLVISVRDPFFDNSSITEIDLFTEECIIREDKKTFQRCLFGYAGPKRVNIW